MFFRRLRKLVQLSSVLMNTKQLYNRVHFGCMLLLVPKVDGLLKLIDGFLQI